MISLTNPVLEPLKRRNSNYPCKAEEEKPTALDYNLDNFWLFRTINQDPNNSALITRCFFSITDCLEKPPSPFQIKEPEKYCTLFHTNVSF